MMKTLQKYILIIIAILSTGIYSCEKEISIDLPTQEPKIVVEGFVETGKAPYVVITRTAPYFEPIDSNTTDSIFVFDAKIYVNDGTTFDTLSLEYNPMFFPPLVYKSHNLIGEVGKTYNLTVEADGEVYTASTSVLNPVEIDSIWFELYSGIDDSLGNVRIRFLDPIGESNYYKIFSKSLSRDKKFVYSYGWLRSDDMIDGDTIYSRIYHGTENNDFVDTINYEEETEAMFYQRILFEPGEEVVVKLCAIEYEHYRFWDSYQRYFSNEGNPYASPTSLVTNISGKAIGIWGSYAASLDTVICIPEEEEL